MITMDRSLAKFLGKIGLRSPHNLMLSLIDSFCIPILTFGIECLYLVFMSKSDREKIDFAYSTIFCKIFNVKERLNIQLCQYYSGCLPPSFRIDLKTLNFVSTLTCHKNSPLPLQLFMLFGKREYDNMLKKYIFCYSK